MMMMIVKPIKCVCNVWIDWNDNENNGSIIIIINDGKPTKQNEK